MTCYRRETLVIDDRAFDIVVDRCWPKETWFAEWHMGGWIQVFEYGDSPEEAVANMRAKLAERYMEAGLPVTE